MKIFQICYLYRVSDGKCVMNNCFVSILFELLVTSYFDLVEKFYLLVASSSIFVKIYKIRAVI